MNTCSIEDCGRPVRRSGLCWCHTKRRQKGLPLHVPVRTRHASAEANFFEAMCHFWAVDELDDRAYELAKKRLFMAMTRFQRYRDSLRGREHEFHMSQQTPVGDEEADATTGSVRARIPETWQRHESGD
jgi:hypothetical protein